MLRPHTYRGKLIVVEGIDGSGKSTQIDLLVKWLQSKGRTVYFSEWNSSGLVKSTTRLGKKEKMFTPTSFSLLQATDFAERWENLILPMLKAGVMNGLARTWKDPKKFLYDVNKGLWAHHNKINPNVV